MRVLIALTLYVSLTHGLFAQVTDQVTGNVQKYLAAGEYINAETSLRALLEKAPRNAQAVNIQIALADLLREEGRTHEARELFEEVRRSPKFAASEDWRVHMDLLRGLADLDSHNSGSVNNQSINAGLAEWNEAISLAHSHNDAVAEANTLRGLAISWLDAGSPGRAEPLLRRSLRMLGSEQSARPWDMASAFTAMGQCYRDEGKFMLAEDSFLRALELDRTSLGDAHPQVAFIMEQLAGVNSMLKRFERAREYSARATEAMRTACGGESLAVANALVVEAEVDSRTNRASEAADKCSRALEIVRNHPCPKYFEVRLMQLYANVLKAIHRDREARALGTEVKSLLRGPG